MATTALAALALALSACAGSLEHQRATGVAERRTGGAPEDRAVERCETLDDRRQIFGGIGKGAGLLAGASGISTIPLEEADPAYRTAAAIGSLGFAAVAATTWYIAEKAGDSWARQCSP